VCVCVRERERERESRNNVLLIFVEFEVSSSVVSCVFFSPNDHRVSRTKFFLTFLFLSDGKHIHGYQIRFEFDRLKIHGYFWRVVGLYFFKKLNFIFEKISN
jgi:hypothetical protein